ncbi:MAG TPA: ABC transporter substrate-binding protein [Burkholderiales bacterium]|nr:ABC transporter substrate-binding protein [Burkholderiales bacterium]
MITQVPDAVATGLVDSLSRPGHNVTGVQLNTAETAAKTLEILREILPRARTVVSLVDLSSPVTGFYSAEVARAAKLLSLSFQTIALKSSGNLDAALPELSRLRPQAALVQPTLGLRAAEMLLTHGVPAVSPSATLAPSALITYSADLSDIYRIAAGYVDRILKGARPAELPVQQPTKFELVINHRTSRALGIDFPASIVARADRAIE